MKSLRIFFDLDETLATRDCPLSRETCELIINVLHRGWDFCLLTGRDLANVEMRVLRPLLALPSMDLATFGSQIQLVTCEGANSWRLTPSGATILDPTYPVAFRFSDLERRQLTSCLSKQLPNALGEVTLSLAMPPEWWEDALLVFKVAGDLSRRPRLVELLKPRLQESGAPIRVSLAGKTTVVIAHRELSKRRALAEMCDGCGSKCNVFVADEFVAGGNDADTVDLNGIIKVSVGNAAQLPSTVLCAGTQGPESTKRWLTTLLMADVSAFSNAESLIRHATQCWEAR